MTMVPPDLPLLLLDLIALQRPLALDRIASLDDADWRTIDAMAREHRLRRCCTTG
jgi:hypothetical protein